MKSIEIRYHDDVVRFIKTLDTRTKAKVSRVIDLLERYGNELRMPYSKPLAQGLFELRTRGRPAVRVIFVYRGHHAVLVHAFIKKSSTIPRADIEQALRNKPLDTI